MAFNSTNTSSPFSFPIGQLLAPPTLQASGLPEEEEEVQGATSGGLPSSDSQAPLLDRQLCELLLGAQAAGLMQPLLVACMGVRGRLLGG